MKRLAVLFVLLCSGALLSAEDSLLAQLQRETREIAAAADAALVTVEGSGGGGISLAPSGQRWHRAATEYYVAAGYGLAQAWTGVLVGDPPKVVLPYAAAQKRRTVDVGLSGGKTARAQRVDGDAELGVAVYSLPEDAARGRKGLAIETDWAALRRGSLAVLAGSRRGGHLGLSMVTGSDPARGLLHGRHGSGGAVLVGTAGALMGLRGPGGAAGSRTCAQCHTTSAASVYAKRVRTGLLNALDPKTGRMQGWTWAAPVPHPVVAGSSYVAGPVIARVVDDIEKHGRIRYGYLGVVVGDVRGEAEKRGVAIASVMEGSPAAKAGLERGATVTAMDGVPCRGAGTLSRMLVHKRPGDTVTLTLAGSRDEVEVTLADRAEAQKHLVTPRSLGLVCVELSDELRSFLGIAAGVKGVVVQEVRAGSDAHRAGLRRGDLIGWAGESDVTGLEELHAAIASARGSIKVAGKREGAPFSHTIVLRPEKKRRDR